MESRRANTTRARDIGGATIALAISLVACAGCHDEFAAPGAAEERASALSEESDATRRAGDGASAADARQSEGRSVEEAAPESFGERLADQDLVAHMRVLSTRGVRGTMGRRGTDAIWTEVTFEVIEVVRDRGADVRGGRLRMRTIGGRVGDETMVVSGAPRWRVGDEAIVAATPGRRPWPTMGGQAGIRPIEEGRVLDARAGAPVVGVSGDGVRLVSEAGAPEPMPLPRAESPGARVRAHEVTVAERTATEAMRAGDFLRALGRTIEELEAAPVPTR
jgi:hypothetical protein